MDPNARTRTILSLLLVIAAAALLAAGCGGDDGDGEAGSAENDAASQEDAGEDGEDGSGEPTDASDTGPSFCEGDTPPAERADAYAEPSGRTLDEGSTWNVTIETSAGTMSGTLDPSAGPIAAGNFVFLADNCFYDGLIFHRVIPGFVIQGGDPLGTGTGGPGYAIDDDPVEVPYEEGTLAMANAGPDTGGSQFFIIHGEQGTSLPPNYAIFGKVTEGLDVLEQIATAPTEAGPSGAGDFPVDPVTIESIRVSGAGAEAAADTDEAAGTDEG